MQQDRELTIDITGLDTYGNGVGRDGEGKVVFVPGALPDETWRVAITQRKHAYSIGRGTKALLLSPARITPDCPSYDRCGGCQLRHYSYEAELEFKRQTVIDALTRIGAIANADALVAPVLPSGGANHQTAPSADRTKVLLPIGGTTGNVVIGFFERGSHTIVPFAGCLNTSATVARIITKTTALLSASRYAPYDEKTSHGILRHLLVRTSPYTHQVMVALVVTKRIGDRHFWGELATQLQSCLEPEEELVALYETLNEKATNVALSSNHVRYYGDKPFCDEVCGVKIAALPHTFLQVNSKQANRLVQTALDLADLAPESNVLDLYCGAGSFSLPLAQRVRHVDGVEINPMAITLAQQNAKSNDLNNVTFTAKKVEAWLTAERLCLYDAVLVDPPRAGLKPNVTEVLSQSGPPKLIYVSCNPATLARDLALLKEAYTICSVQPVDMFPRTTHVECVCLMTRNK